METKRITDLTILESLSDAANVLVEENGEAKRVPANKLGGASSWNDLTDKPFGEETTSGDTLIWDGTPSGVSINGTHYWISDVIVTKDDCANGIVLGGSPIPAEVIQECFGEDDFGSLEGGVLFVPYDDYKMGDVTIPKSGIYALPDVAPLELTVPGKKFVTTRITKIDDKFLPDTVSKQAVLFVGTEGDAIRRLYKDETRTEMLTQDELIAICADRKTIMLVESSTSFGYVVSAETSITGGGGCVSSLVVNTDGSVSGARTYTAEYTGS